MAAARALAKKARKGSDSFDLGDSCQNFPTPTQMRAFIWNGGAIQDLGTLGGTDSCALWVNEKGQVAGQSFTNSLPNPTTGVPTLHPFFWDGKRTHDVGSLGGAMSVVSQYNVGLNNGGQVVGVSTLAGDLVDHPFLWSKDVLMDLGTLGGDYGQATAINDAGQVVGDAYLPGNQTYDAFLWQNGVMTDLGTLGQNSLPNAINARGQVVGTSLMNDGTQHAFLWENGGPMIDLNVFVALESKLTLTNATSINDRGEIAVQAVLSNGDQRAFLLRRCGEGIEGCTGAAGNITVATQSPSAANWTAVTAAPHFEHRSARRRDGHLISRSSN